VASACILDEYAEAHVGTVSWKDTTTLFNALGRMTFSLSLQMSSKVSLYQALSRLKGIQRLPAIIWPCKIRRYRWLWVWPFQNQTNLTVTASLEAKVTPPTVGKPNSPWEMSLRWYRKVAGGELEWSIYGVLRRSIHKSTLWTLKISRTLFLISCSRI